MVHDLNSLQNHRITLADPDAHGDEGVAALGFAQGSGGGEGEARTGHSEGVAQGDGSAVGVDARVEVVEAEAAGDREGLSGKGFVEFDVVDVGQGESGALEGELGGGHGADAHDAGFDARDSARDDAGQGRERVDAKARFRGNEQCSSAVVKA